MPVENRPHIRIEPPAGWAALRLGELWEYRDVLVMLALRDVKVRYKQTAIGICWVVLQPILAAGIFALVFGRYAKLPSDGKPYVVFVFAGLLIWNLFSGIVQRAGNSLVADARLITKVYFPRLLIPFAAATATLVDYGVSLIIMIIMLLWYDISPSWWLLLLPIVTAIALGLAIGVSLWIAALSVRYRDFIYASPFFIQLVMYASPVVYGLGLIPEKWRDLYAMNPLVGILGGGRAAFLGGDQIWWPLLISAVCAGLALSSGMLFFRRAEQSFADSI